MTCETWRSAITRRESKVADGPRHERRDRGSDEDRNKNSNFRGVARGRNPTEGD